MTIYDIINYLKTIEDYDTLKIIDKGYNVLIKYNIDEDFITESSNLIFSQSDQLDVEITDGLKDLLGRQLMSILKLCGVTLNDSITLDDLIDIVDALSEIEYYTDKDTIIRLLESDFNSSELFAEIMALFTKYNVVQLLSFIEDIKDIFYLAVKRLFIEDSSETIYNDIEENRDKIESYKKFKANNNVELYCDRFIKNINVINMPISDYIALYNQYLTLNEEDNETIGLNLIGMSILSSDSRSDTVLTVIRRVLSNVVPELKTSMIIDTFISKKIVELNNG